MKNFYTALSILLLCFVINISKAQTDQSAPTKQDALDFINKVLKEFPGTESTNSGDGSTVFPTITATLDGCHLTFKSDFSFPNTGDNTTWVASRITIINLSSVYTTDNTNLNSATDGDIIRFYNAHTVKPNGKVNWSGPPHQDSIASFWIGELLFRSHIEEPAQFKDQHYDDRFTKAVMFLVKACGGGKMKVDATQKF
jgi:hypothetical protein